MGSFDVSCGASGLPINCGDAAFLLPLVPSKHNGLPESLMTSQIVSNDGCYALFSPYFLPIAGTYDDYGRILVKEANPNRNLIEDLSGVDISLAANHFTAMDDIISTLPAICAAMWIRQDVYYEIAAIDMMKWSRKFDDIVARLEDKRNSLLAFAGDVFMREQVLSTVYTESGFHLGGYFNNRIKTYHDLILNREIKKQLSWYMAFYWQMLLNNRIFMPTALGAQHGDWKASRRMSDAIAHAVKGRAK